MITTKRFAIHSQEVDRGNLGHSRIIFHAWFRDDDIPRPVCIVTINPHFMNFVEWIHVEDSFRRTGIATEVLQAIENSIGEVFLSAATDEGEAFCDSFEKMREGSKQ